ncbi:NADPH oxidase regulator NoxR, partial [Basidiobolus meristosporus CBS 931.73]
AELEQWLLATKAFDDKDYAASLDLFEGIADSAKILFNIGVILGAMNDHESAIHAYVSALQLDQYFAIAYFQKGVSNMILEDFHAAFDDFNDALLYLRGNLYIDYSQLGLTFKLYSCEVLYNRALCYFQLNEDALGMNDLLAAQKEKQIGEHRIVDRAIDNKG